MLCCCHVQRMLLIKFQMGTQRIIMIFRKHHSFHADPWKYCLIKPGQDATKVGGCSLTCGLVSSGSNAWMTCSPLPASQLRPFTRSCTGTITPSHQGLWLHTCTHMACLVNRLKWIKDGLFSLPEQYSSTVGSTNNQLLTHCSALLSPPRFYGGALILLCLLYVAPVGWVLAGFNSAIFFWNRDFTRG